MFAFIRRRAAARAQKRDIQKYDIWSFPKKLTQKEQTE